MATHEDEAAVVNGGTELVLKKVGCKAVTKLIRLGPVYKKSRGRMTD